MHFPELAREFPFYLEYTEYEFLPRRTGNFTEHSVTQESTDDQEDSESGCSENKRLHHSGNISQPVHY